MFTIITHKKKHLSISSLNSHYCFGSVLKRLKSNYENTFLLNAQTNSPTAHFLATEHNQFITDPSPKIDLSAPLREPITNSAIGQKLIPLPRGCSKSDYELKNDFFPYNRVVFSNRNFGYAF